MSYKILIASYPPDKLFSCRVAYALRVTYKLNKWIKPPHGPSLVFGTIAAARAFSYSHHGDLDIIYRCRTKGRRPVSTVLRRIFELDKCTAINSVRAFWNCPPAINVPTMKAPPGTYAADEVMLTRRIGLSIKW